MKSFTIKELMKCWINAKKVDYNPPFLLYLKYDWRFNK